VNIYVELTETFNSGRLRAVLSSGQAVVFHQLAVMSKDGDWILREDEETIRHVRQVLAQRQARYRFGAPLDLRWLKEGWSSHFEFRCGSLRVRTDFVTRPPRLTSVELASLWAQVGEHPFPVVGVRDLCELKKTNREKDYAVIGELARLLDNPRDQLLLSRSARDLVEFARRHPELVRELMTGRPVLASVDQGLDAVESALDAERRRLIHANEARLQRYLDAASAWREAWPGIEATLEGLPIEKAHEQIVRQAESLLPFAPVGGAEP
jgi:hypothetical protein